MAFARVLNVLLCFAFQSLVFLKQMFSTYPLIVVMYCITTYFYMDIDEKVV